MLRSSVLNGEAPELVKAPGPGYMGSEGLRWRAYVWLAVLISLVSDGWSGKPSLRVHQLLLLPLLFGMVWALLRILRPANAEGRAIPRWWPSVLLCFEALSLAMFVEEGRHFAAFGYKLQSGPLALALVVITAVWGWALWKRGAWRVLSAVLVSYGAGLFLAIRCFPLNYLRSDMLPVIDWADARILQHLNPYGTMHVGDRLYDFPYLPGMLVGFLPFEMVHADLRVGALLYVIAAAVIIFLSARETRRFEVAVLLGVFLLCPFLQYRHDLYLQPHWFTLAVAIALMKRGQGRWSALVWGMSCGVYQLSWILVPFFLLNAYWRRGFRELLKLAGLTAVGAMIIVGPFLRSASERIASNTVGQWSRLPHALADPVNLSYWLTFVVRPDELKWVQGAVLVALFAFCVYRRRCGDLTDTLRWMSCALAVFIPLNVIVDGYFYLTLLLVLLMYVCAANGWWEEPGGLVRPGT